LVAPARALLRPALCGETVARARPLSRKA